MEVEQSGGWGCDVLPPTHLSQELLERRRPLLHERVNLGHGARVIDTARVGKGTENEGGETNLCVRHQCGEADARDEKTRMRVHSLPPRTWVAATSGAAQRWTQSTL